MERNPRAVANTQAQNPNKKNMTIIYVIILIIVIVIIAVTVFIVIKKNKANKKCTGVADNTVVEIDSTHIATCENGKATKTTHCANGIDKSDTKAIKCITKSFCTDKADGKHVNGNDIITCAKGVETNTETCEYGPNTTKLICNDICYNKSDGLHAEGNTIYTCKDNVVSKKEECPNGVNTESTPIKCKTT